VEMTRPRLANLGWASPSVRSGLNIRQGQGVPSLGWTRFLRGAPPHEVIQDAPDLERNCHRVSFVLGRAMKAPNAACAAAMATRAHPAELVS
jgi:hypothetical protein